MCRQASDGAALARRRAWRGRTMEVVVMFTLSSGTSLALHPRVLIRRCAWHRAYFGHPIVFGIGSWRGLGISFTDGMCLRCTGRFRQEWNLPPPKTNRTPLRPAHALARAAVFVLVAASFTLAERRVDHSRSLGTLALPPETVLVPPAPVEEGLPSALPISTRPRRVRRPVSMEVLADAHRPVVFAAPIEPVAAPVVVASLTEPAPAPAPRPRSAIPLPELVLPEITEIRRPPERPPVEVAAVPHAGLVQQAP